MAAVMAADHGHEGAAAHRSRCAELEACPRATGEEMRERFVRHIAPQTAQRCVRACGAVCKYIKVKSKVKKVNL